MVCKAGKFSLSSLVFYEADIPCAVIALGGLAAGAFDGGDPSQGVVVEDGYSAVGIGVLGEPVKGVVPVMKYSAFGVGKLCSVAFGVVGVADAFAQG